MNVVLVPAWRRPEMLFHCLANIKRAEGASDHHFIFRFDQGHTKELYDVIRDFPFSHEVAPTPRTGYRRTKQSFSLLSGYHLASEKSDRLVYLIEEDIMVATDFFSYHRAVHDQRPDLFCSIAVANHNRTITEEGAADEYYLTTLDYCSWGVCFDKRVLMEHVIPAATYKYYVNAVEYCRKNFPGTPFTGDEQDGLIRRVQWKLGMDRPIAYPFTPRAFHGGLYGYNRGTPPSGTFQKRLEYVSRVIYSPDAMRTLGAHPDSTPVNLNAASWQTLRLHSIDLDRNPRRV